MYDGIGKKLSDRKIGYWYLFYDLRHFIQRKYSTTCAMRWTELSLIFTQPIFLTPPPTLLNQNWPGKVLIQFLIAKLRPNSSKAGLSWVLFSLSQNFWLLLHPFWTKTDPEKYWNSSLLPSSGNKDLFQYVSCSVLVQKGWRRSKKFWLSENKTQLSPA